MELTGKCKEDFEKWYEQSEYRKYFQLTGVMSDTPFVFYKVPTSMQFGVYVDFFDSVGIWCDIQPAYNEIGVESFIFNIVNGGEIYNDDENYQRHEAQTKAIEKANEIYNQTKDEPTKE